MRILLAAVAAVVLTSGTAHAAAFTNGSFESGISPGTFTTLNAGDSSSITGWTVTSGSIDYIGSYWQAGNGSRSLDMSGNGPGSIAQTFDTVAGATYQVTFLLAGNTDGSPTTKTLNVWADGGRAAGYSFDTTGKSASSMGWTQFTYNFMAIGASTTLTFSSTTGTAYGAALDNVTVSRVAAVPEPASWAMLIAGFGLMGGTLRRRRTATQVVA
ncbi:MAG: choice-of-anchor C family protein [Sphingomonas sp.]|uniref:choice-of-anchor C family PEP-CTERM protein n=1 Tax=Sphingomonas sp. TaxID=28214 RepID=UPI001ACEFCFB|nr:choice-of-anchor C family protein [Sphingomonas sp.]MBN8809172.1 choice-of-anchor C family protein [Sphingomonas sp.]